MNRGNARPTTVIGGTGFLGRRIVERLASADRPVRVAVRHPERALDVFPAEFRSWIETVPVDVRDRALVAACLAGSQAVVNAVSAYVERRGMTYEDVHERGAWNVAECARRAGVETLVHVSGIGADPHARSRYIRARGRGEELVRRGFGAATIVRPSVMFGPDDAFLNGLAAAVRAAPILPVFGARTLLQPVHVADVAEAVCRILGRDGTDGARVFELGGPRVYSFRAMLKLVAHAGRRRPVLVPIPMQLGRISAWMMERLPRPPLTVAQIELLARDNVASPEAPGWTCLGIVPTALEPLVHARFEASPRRPQRAEG